jgi:uncharacterized protein (DUF433 family)
VTMDWRAHIHSDPEIMAGKPVVRGTRITVELILEYFEDGGSVQDIRAAYDYLSAEDVRAAIAFAKDVLVDAEESASRKAA